MQTGSNPYDGQFNQLKYTEVAYRGNRRANSGREKLASANLGGKAQGFQGNFYYAVGYDTVQGLNQNNLLAQTSPWKFYRSRCQIQSSRRIIHS